MPKHTRIQARLHAQQNPSTWNPPKSKFEQERKSGRVTWDVLILRLRLVCFLGARHFRRPTLCTLLCNASSVAPARGHEWVRCGFTVYSGVWCGAQITPASQPTHLQLALNPKLSSRSAKPWAMDSRAWGKHAPTARRYVRREKWEGHRRVWVPHTRGRLGERRNLHRPRVRPPC